MSSSQPPVVAPTQDDPLVRHLSESAGGPAGRRLRSPDARGRRGGADGPRSRFWSVPRILTALTVVAILLSALSAQYCRINGWGGVGVYHAGCYSDVAALYTQRGLGTDPWAPFVEGGWFEYPVLTGLIATGMALITRGVQSIVPAESVLAYWDPSGTLLYWDVTFIAGAAAWILLVLTVMKAAGRRPWDAAIVAVSPAIIFGAGINWDLFAAAALGLAILAYLRGQHMAAGVLIGVGISLKIFPLFMLGAVLVLALRTHRRGVDDGARAQAAAVGTATGSSVAGARPTVDEPTVRLADFARMLGAAVVSWLVLNVPAMLASFEAWAQFFVFSAERGAGYSSPWYVWQLVAEARGGAGPSPETVSTWGFLLFAGACAGVLVLGLTTRHRPRMVQLLLLIVMVFVLVSKVYSPQFMVWLVPLIALAAPRWRDVVIWTVFQLLHFWATWMFLAGVVGDYEPQHTMDDGVYVLAVLGHMAACVYLMVRVIMDIRRPDRNPVRAPRAERNGEQLRREDDAAGLAADR